MSIQLRSLPTIAGIGRAGGLLTLPTMRTFTDQLGRPVDILFPPQRIVSLVPSQTELLHHLGLEKAVVGITKFCVHPEHWFRSKTRIGGTKMVHFDRIEALNPDLIIGNKEENTRSDIEQLAARYPVWLSDIRSLADALWMIEQVGRLVDRDEKGRELARAIRQAFDRLATDLAALPRLRAAYLIWRRPYMAAAADTFIHTMLQEAGFDNVFADRQRYPEITLEQLREARPEVLLLSSEPYPFREKHLEEFRQALPQTRIHLVDGELFSWYGSRLLRSPGYFWKLRKALP